MLLILSISTIDCYSSNIIKEPTKLTYYNESIKIDASGKAVSHIKLQLSNPGSQLYLPLIINDEVAILKKSKTYQIRLSGIRNARYLVIKSIDNKPLKKNIELDIAYENLLISEKSWSTLEGPKLLIDYSEYQDYYWTATEYSATISFPENVMLEPFIKGSDKLLNEHLSIEYHKTDPMKAVILRASNIGFKDINYSILLKSSSTITPYIVIIAILIIVYLVFLRFLFKS